MSIIFDKYEMLDEHGLYLNKETNEELWWTNIIYDKAYDIVKDRKYPVLIPSYNNPNPSIVKGFLSDMNDEFNYPIIIFVRQSQYDDYVKENTNKYATIVGFPDDQIIGAGNARRMSLKWLYSQGYEHAFSFDDDAQWIGMTERGFTGAGDPKSQAIKDTVSAKVLAVWQLFMEILEKDYNNVMLTGIYPVGFSWKKEYCWCDQTALLYRGNLNQVVCLNVKNLIENKIIYRDNKECGHEDIDLILQGLEKDMVVATFPFLCYSTPPMNCDNFLEFGSNMQERFKSQQAIMYNNWKDCEYVTFRDKRDLAQVVINFRKYRKLKNIDNYVIDIWKNGSVL